MAKHGGNRTSKKIASAFVALNARTRQIWDLKVAGKTYEEIEDLLGIPKSTAHAAIRRQMAANDARNQNSIEEQRQIQAARLNVLWSIEWARYMKLTGAPTVGATPKRRKKVNPREQEIILNGLLAISDRQSRLFGLDKNASVNLQMIKVMVGNEAREASPTDAAELTSRVMAMAVQVPGDMKMAEFRMLLAAEMDKLATTPKELSPSIDTEGVEAVDE